MLSLGIHTSRALIHTGGVLQWTAINSSEVIDREGEGRGVALYDREFLNNQNT